MEYRQWLFRSYKTDDGKLLENETVEAYCKAFDDLKAYLIKNENITLTDLSVSDMKNLHGRLGADKVFTGLANGETMLRTLGLYIQFRERE